MDDSASSPNAPNNDALTPSSLSSSTAAAPSFDDEWEEWDGTSPFWVHCVAGSMAGVAEHVLVYPLDTVRTHIQVCAACNFNPATHNASTQAATMAAKGASPPIAANATTNYNNNNKAKNVPGAILQQAASKCKTGLRSGMVSAAARGGGTGGILGGTSNAAGSQNLSMLQAIRQLVSSQPLALEPAAAAAAATTTTTGGGAASASASAALKNAAATVTNTATSTEAAGLTRLWRGVQTILVGCIPAHALYFSTYEIVKAATLDDQGKVTAYGSALAGGAAVVSHDIVLGPLDTVKQRLQLGHYHGLTDALTQMIRNEGAVSLLRSFPITLATNIPYGMIMVGTNEFLKDQWTHTGDTNNNAEPTLAVTLGASSLAGLVAAATTTPLDRIKTYLQTQQLAPSCLLQQRNIDAGTICPYGGSGSGTAATTAQQQHHHHKPIVADWRQAALRIYRKEGPSGFFRGMTPRILSHTPAVAISWTTYETFKKYFQRHFVGEE